MNGIWDSIEAECWARDYTYEQYLDLHETTCVEGDTLCKEAYEMMCGALTEDLVRGFRG